MARMSRHKYNYVRLQVQDTLPPPDVEEAQLGMDDPNFVCLENSKLVIDADPVDYQVNQSDIGNYQVNHDEEPLVPEDSLYPAYVPRPHSEFQQESSTRERHASAVPSAGAGEYARELDSYHCHPPKYVHTAKARNQLLTVACLCFVFMVAEIFGGVISNSLALVTDATHMASDLSGFVVSLFAIWVAKKDPTAKMSFGFHRAEVLGAIVSVLIIWLTTGVLVYLAVERVIHQEYEIKADEMLITAGLGVAFNIIMGITLHGGFFKCNVPHAHSHLGLSQSHGDVESHNENVEQNGHANLHGQDTSLPAKGSKEKRNINVRAALIHVLGDLIQSIGVLIAAYIIKFHPEYKIADPICTFIFSILVLFTTITILRDACLVIMEGVPRGFNIAIVKEDLKNIQGVKAVHSLHVWALTMDKNALSTHIAVDKGTDMDLTVKTATYLLRNKYNMFNITVQVESFDEAKMSECFQCIGPKGL